MPAETGMLAAIHPLVPQTPICSLAVSIICMYMSLCKSISVRNRPCQRAANLVLWPPEVLPYPNLEQNQALPSVDPFASADPLANAVSWPMLCLFPNAIYPLTHHQFTVWKHDRQTGLP